MSRLNEYAQPVPDSVAPKGDGDFITFEPFPESGPTILTILGVKEIKDYESFNKEKNQMDVYDALEFIAGTITDKGPRFLKMWPMKNSIHEKAKYYALYKAAMGTPPPAKGSNARQIVGKGISADLLNEDKVSKKGTPYVRTSLKGVSSVHPKLRGEIVPLADLLPALEKALQPKPRDGVAPAPAARQAAPVPVAIADEDAPF
jgi:hypothetical protein